MDLVSTEEIATIWLQVNEIKDIEEMQATQQN